MLEFQQRGDFLEKYFPLLQKCPLFAQIKPEELSLLLDCLQAKPIQKGKGEILLQEGEPVTEFGILLEGKAAVYRLDFWGSRNLMSNLMPGDIFGEVFACLPGQPSTVCVAAETACTVLLFRQMPILAPCSKGCSFHQQLIRNLIGVLAEKNLRFSEKLNHMGQRTTREKLLSFFSAQAVKQHSSTFQIPFNQQQLADYLCVERSAMAAVLGKLKAEGLISWEKNTYTLYDVEDWQESP
jgi:CRP/FNR family cyclic AMP-dependent transcriptional regulator